MILSIVSKRLLYLKEFKRGLDHCGFPSALQNNADLCKVLFLINQDEVDANYVILLLRPKFSKKGSSKQPVEETVFDHLHDFILYSQDTTVTGYTEELAYDHEDTEDWCGEQKPEELSQVHFQCVDISPSGLLGWLTGQRHRPINGDNCLSWSSLTMNACNDNTITPFVFVFLQETSPCQWSICKMKKSSKGLCFLLSARDRLLVKVNSWFLIYNCVCHG